MVKRRSKSTKITSGLFDEMIIDNFAGGGGASLGPDYRIEIQVKGKRLSTAAQVRMCGNSVSPPVAEALVRANFAVGEGWPTLEPAMARGSA